MPSEVHAPQGGENNPAQPAGTPADLAAQIASAVEAALAKSVPAVVNAALTNRFERFESKIDAKLNERIPPPAEPKGKAEQEAALKARLDTLEREREDERKERAKEKRENALREEIRKQGVSDPEAVFRYVLPDLSLNAEGEYFAKDANGGFQKPADFIKATVERNAWMQPKTKPGGGSVPTANGSSPSSDQPLDPKLPPEERLRMAHERRAKQLSA